VAKPETTNKLTAIEDAVRIQPDGATLGQIVAVLGIELPRRTLQHYLKLLTDSGRLVRKGEKRGARYDPPSAVSHAKGEEARPLSNPPV
jgi:hypothetical protein